MRAAIADEERWWSVSGRPIYDHFDNFVGFRGSGTDLTERKRSQENATRLARYDSLTGLANRFQMSQSLEKILSAPQEIQPQLRGLPARSRPLQAGQRYAWAIRLAMRC